MRIDDELRTLRRRQGELGVASDRGRGRDGPEAGAPACLVRTTTVASYPTAVNLYFMCLRAIPGGTEAEGQAVTLSTIGSPFPVAIVGSAVPPSGTYLIARQVGGRWGARYQ
jgi:hypothetical protein